MNLIDPGPPLTVAEIEAFEQEIGGRLPDDYKLFLLACNGGMNEPPLGLHWNGTLHKVPDFDRLLATSETGLRRALRNLRELNIDGFLPITSTQNQEDICLAIRDKIGTVWLALPVYANDVPIDATLFKLAGSFTEFCNSLVPIPVVYCPIEELGKNGTEADLEAYLAEGNSIDTVGKNYHTILREAIKFGNQPMIEACIARGASLSKTVYMAVQNRRLDLVQRFVDAGADVNEQDEYGDRPLQYVPGTALPGEEGARNRAMYNLLIELGAK
ncbi:MAG: SMI1/KNR4 family protein [Planctomycetaceae bacterium]|nr:SMI1/KNR4 family protein [Planctomycetaceae bacterium]